ncbi:unnamed protein product [Choristocarpus tenellus]
MSSGGVLPRKEAGTACLPLLVSLLLSVLIFVRLFLCWLYSFDTVTIAVSTPDLLHDNRRVVLEQGAPQSVAGSRALLSRHRGEGWVAKTVFSDTTRVVFIAGLEGGGGHRYFAAAMKKCREDDICRTACNISHAFFPKLVRATTLQEYEEALVGAETAFAELKAIEREIVREGQREDESGTAMMIALNCLPGCGTGPVGFPAGRMLGPTHSIWPTQHYIHPVQSRALVANTGHVIRGP